jgi:hypothetical protein
MAVLVGLAEPASGTSGLLLGPPPPMGCFPPKPGGDKTALSVASIPPSNPPNDELRLLNFVEIQPFPRSFYPSNRHDSALTTSTAVSKPFQHRHCWQSQPELWLRQRQSIPQSRGAAA